MDLSALATAAKAEPAPPDTFTAQVVRADASGMWVVPLGEDPRHPVGPCRGGYTGNGTLVPVGRMVLLVQTPDGPWVVGLDDPALAINDATLAPFPNPSFEGAQPLDPTQPAGWSDFWSSERRGEGPGTYTRQLEDSTAAHGLRSLRVEGRGTDGAAESGEWSVPAGASLEVSLYARATGLTPYVEAVLWSNTAGQYAGPFGSGVVVNPSLEWVPGPDWLRYRGVITIPPTHTNVNLFLNLGSSGAGTATVWVDNVDADLVEIDPAAAHQDYLRRAALVLAGGGVRLVTAGGNITWSQPFTIAGAGREPSEAVDGRFEIVMPTAGTVVPVHSSGVRVSHTVAGGVIALNVDDALWYELPLGAAATSQPGRFHIIGSTSADNFTVPPHWILVVRRGNWSVTNHAPEYQWGDGLRHDPWRTPSLNAGWVDGTMPGRFTKLHNGDVRMKGRVRSGTGSAFTLPTGYKPLDTHSDIVCDGVGAAGLLTVTSGGVVTTGGSNTDHSIETTFPAEQ